MIDPATERVVADARRLLQAVLAEEADGRAPYARDVRRFVEPQLGLPFPSFVQFLERYGFVGLDRRTDLLSVTKAGRDIVDAHDERTAGLVGDARHHFGDRLDALADAPAAPAEAEVRLSEDYYIGGCIGEGGLGTVYRGRHRATDRPVAIKLVDGLFDLFTPAHHAELRRRFELAVRAHARLVSPFIVQVLHHDPSHAPPYVVTELAPGGDLRRLLDRGPLPPSVALRYTVQIALGLKVAHQQGLYHRDLKPENVLLDAQGNAKLVDFGFARVAERDGRRVRQAYVGYGSVGYMAPEMFRPGTAASPATDLYALGILLYEMLTGQLPGRRAPMPGARVEGVPTDLDDIFDRMTRDDPAERPADVDAVLTALWTSKAIVALLDARQAPLFVEPPIALQPEPEPEPEAEPAGTPAPEADAAPAAAPDANAGESAIEAEA
ncbi:MAG: serine/threonine protein kinase, partial [Myxococcales bacterium]|nr:serine/threonine protein kinase [Myxococcales bacterium]